jgi:4-alpha-glucanotransferase
VWDTLKNGHLDEGAVRYEAQRAFDIALDRIGNEELWVFKDFIKGEKDINRLELHPFVKSYLMWAWGNRLFMEYEKGKFVPVWKYKDTRAYRSLSDNERGALDDLIGKKNEESEKDWEKHGKKLLTLLVESSEMLPCAEDLGAVPACVPKVLAKLNILGLRVVRWFRDWYENGQPYVAFENYPELSVCTPSVHDSSTLREWWEQEADKHVFGDFIGEPSLPHKYNPGTARKMLKEISSAASRLRVFQIQDLLHLSYKSYAYSPDPGSERINVPGMSNEFNWTYRLPVGIEEIAQDEELLKAVVELSTVKSASKKKGTAHKKTT